MNQLPICEHGILPALGWFLSLELVLPFVTVLNLVATGGAKLAEKKVGERVERYRSKNFGVSPLRMSTSGRVVEDLSTSSSQKLIRQMTLADGR